MASLSDDSCNMHVVTVRVCTSATLTLIWSSRRAFQTKEGTIICLIMFYREDQRKEKSDSLKKHTFFHQQPPPPKKRDTTFYELTSKFPLAFFNTPWVRDTAKSQSVLKVRKRTKKKKSRDNYELAANRLLVQKKTTVH